MELFAILVTATTTPYAVILAPDKLNDKFALPAYTVILSVAAKVKPVVSVVVSLAATGTS
jgi:hypothetical protein